MKSLFFLILILILIKPAHAYIDPGTGSLILQLLVTGTLTLVFFIKLKWKQLVLFIKTRVLKNSVINDNDSDQIE